MIDFSEYEGAVLAMVGCMRDRGYATAEEPVPDALLSYHLVFKYGPGELEAGRAANQECFREYLSEVSMAWAEFVAPNSAKILSDARSAFLECYRRRLKEQSRDASPEYADLKEALIRGDADAGACLIQTKTQFKLPLWGG
ncbi:MAG: hypothetical protein HYX53_10690 [Chloroflexi bacterium]|nr:hypothetical protein [Chloroflexota bacterium]